MTTLYLDCFSGAAGDMLLAALLDAGVPQEVVTESLRALEVSGWELRVEQVTKSGLASTRVKVISNDEEASRTHGDIRQLLETSSLDGNVRTRALDTFQILATAEAKIHGQDPEQVHFHEVGGIDAIIDIVGCAAALEHLSPTSIVCSPLVTGRGWATSAHGPIPIPAPATLEILRDVPLEQRGDQELVTPTGAAILVAACDRFGPMPPLRVHAIGYGAGERDLQWPNVVRVLIGMEQTDFQRKGAWLIETNIDDMSPELIPHCIEMLIRSGASDAWSTPILMKKGRPALTLSVLVDDEAQERALDTLYRETTTLGARIRRVEKDELERGWIEVEVQGHRLRVKLGRRGGEVMTVSPEHEDAVTVARATGMALREVHARAIAEARMLLAKKT